MQAVVDNAYSGQRFVETSAGPVPVDQWHQWRALATATAEQRSQPAGQATGLLLQRQIQQHFQQQQQEHATVAGGMAPLHGSAFSPPAAPHPTWTKTTGANSVLHDLLSEAVKTSLSAKPRVERKPSATPQQPLAGSGPEGLTALAGPAGTNGELLGSDAGEDGGWDVIGDGEAEGEGGEGGQGVVEEVELLFGEMLNLQERLQSLGSENEKLKRQLNDQKALMQQMEQALLDQGSGKSGGGAAVPDAPGPAGPEAAEEGVSPRPHPQGAMAQQPSEPLESSRATGLMAGPVAAAEGAAGAAVAYAAGVHAAGMQQAGASAYPAAAQLPAAHAAQQSATSWLDTPPVPAATPPVSAAPARMDSPAPTPAPSSASARPHDPWQAQPTAAAQATYPPAAPSTASPWQQPQQPHQQGQPQPQPQPQPYYQQQMYHSPSGHYASSSPQPHATITPTASTTAYLQHTGSYRQPAAPSVTVTYPAVASAAYPTGAQAAASPYSYPYTYYQHPPPHQQHPQHQQLASAYSYPAHQAAYAQPQQYPSYGSSAHPSHPAPTQASHPLSASSQRWPPTQQAAQQAARPPTTPPRAQAAAPTQATSWSCQVCTYEHAGKEALFLRCSMCNAQR